MKDKAAIAGIGETEYSKNSGMSELALFLQATERAAADAGVSLKDIDGIIVSKGFGPAVKELVTNLGLKELTYTSSIDLGGASPVASVQTAAMVVTAGLARNVLCVTGWNGYSGRRAGRAETASPVTDTLLRRSFEIPFGWQVPAQWYAVMCRRHMHEYGTTSQQLGTIALTVRKHAILNEKALMRKPITMQDYLNSRIIADPFRLFDCCLETDGAAAVLVASAERARDLKQRPVYISGAAIGYPPLPDQIINRPTITELGAKSAAPRAFAMAGVSPRDIDVAEIYDCFTYILLCQLEDIGFCKKGEGGSFVEDGRIELGGELPVNTHGGLLSQAHVLGMNHVVEAVKQLRGQAGAAQVRDAELVLVSGFGDPGMSAVMILRK